MKNKNRVKIFILIAGLILALSTSIGAYYAALTARTDAVTSTFELGSITCDITKETNEDVRTNVRIQNTSEIGVFMRAAIVVTWSNGSGGFYSDVPVEGVDYTIALNDSNWFINNSDGFYYCKNIVAAKSPSPALITEAKLLDTATVPDGYHLSIEIVSTAIQANPKHAVADAWKVVEWNGSKLVEKIS